ncbi:MAG: hypothetical protein WC716_11990 [Chitinophagaceae bacterium]|jgi:hypothetical protein
MKKLLFIFTMALGLATTSFAQSGTISAQNADAIKNFDGIAGNFQYALSAKENLNVNYALTPKVLTSTAHFMLHTPDPMPLSAIITDASGKTVLTWTPETKVYLYNVNWNIASLNSGVYTVKIFMDKDPKSIFQFNFNKQ